MESASRLVAQVLGNNKAIDELRAQQDVMDKEHRDRSWAVGQEYTKRIRAVEAEKDEVLAALKKEHDSVHQEKQIQIEELYKVPQRVKRILDLLRLEADRDLSIPDDAPQPYNGYENMHRESLGYIVDERFLKVKLFIVQNRKPTNKYSLCALSNTIFYEELLKLPKQYGCPFHTKARYSSESVVRDWPTIEAAKAWLARPVNRENLIQQLKGQYDTIAADYAEVVQHYKASQFKALMTAVCEKCGYFYTDLDGRSLRQGEAEECPRCSNYEKGTDKYIKQSMTRLERRVVDST